MKKHAIDALLELDKIEEEEEKTHSLENLGEKKILQEDDMGRQNGYLNLQNVVQIRVAQRKSKGHSHKEIQMDQPQILTQLQDLNLSEEEDQKVNVDEPQLKPENQSEENPNVQSKPQPQPIQKARCQKLSDEPSQVWPLNLNSVYEMRAFLMSPCPPGVKIQCTIQRIRSSYYHRYECYLVCK